LSHYWIQPLLLIGNLSSVGSTRWMPKWHSYRWFAGRDQEVAPTSSPQQMALYLLEMV